MLGGIHSHDDMVALIYEAALMPERWPDLLETLGRRFGAAGGTLGRHAHADPLMLHSPGLSEVIAAYIAGGYHLDGRRTEPLHQSDYPGFVADFDVLTDDQRDAMPVYREFLGPRKLAIGVGTAVVGAAGERLILTLEGFPSRDAVTAAIPGLDRLRPHLARSALLASELQLRACNSMVDGFQRIGAAAAILGDAGRVVAANACFVAEFGAQLADHRDRLRLAHRDSDQQLGAALAATLSTGQGASVAMRDDLGAGVAALHLVPIARAAQEVFVGARAIALVTRPKTGQAPSAQLIQSLFDLTPTEAHVARAVATGESIEFIARQTGKAVETVRSHLKRVYSKTATGRQNRVGGAAPRLHCRRPSAGLSGANTRPLGRRQYYGANGPSRSGRQNRPNPC